MHPQPSVYLPSPFCRGLALLHGLSVAGFCWCRCWAFVAWGWPMRWAVGGLARASEAFGQSDSARFAALPRNGGSKLAKRRGRAAVPRRLLLWPDIGLGRIGWVFECLVSGGYRGRLAPGDGVLHLDDLQPDQKAARAGNHWLTPVLSIGFRAGRRRALLGLQGGFCNAAFGAAGRDHGAGPSPSETSNSPAAGLRWENRQPGFGANRHRLGV